LKRLLRLSPLAASFAIGAALAGVVACGGSASPTAVPTPVATPTPTPTPTPDPNVPPAGSGCGQPYPPPITRFQVKIHEKDADFWQLDATPMVGPDVEYCAAIGFTDGRSICSIRPEGAPDRLACELWRLGKAQDTGRNEPTWIFFGKDGTQSFCSTTDAPAAPCWRYVNDPDNVTKVKAIKGGLYRACAENGACSDIDVDRNL
jgi:hypothetical protein